MILQALARYYDILIKDEESGVSPPGYSRANVSFALNLSEQGELLEIIPLKNSVKRGNKEVEVPRSMIVPERVNRASGISANLLCENSAYALGIDNKGNPQRSKKCFEAFCVLHHEILNDVTCAEAVALLRFLDKWQPELASENSEVMRNLDELMAGANMVFKLDNGEYLHECAAVKAAYERVKNADSTERQQQCLATGELLPIARLHPKLKGVRDTLSAGAALVSFNADSYESYGKSGMQGLNAPVSERVAFAYGTALNYLLADWERRLYLGDSTVVYWAQCAGNTYRNMAAHLFNNDQKQLEAKDETMRDTHAEKLVGSILDKVATGRPFDEAIFDDKTEFYVLGLSPNAARVSVRFFIRSSFGAFVKKAAQHYADLRIEKQFAIEPNAIPLWLLLAQTVSPNAKDKASSPLLSGAVLRAILNGTQYPAALFNAVMLRIKAERDISYYKVSIIKAYLIRKKQERYQEVLTMSLNTQTDNIAYLLGRLFAVMEKAQQDATPGIDATIKDRYFSSASATPASVFPVLLRLSQHHIAKAKYGFHSDKMMEEIIEKIDIESNPIPSNLSLEDQGTFVIAYYHQRNALYIKKAVETKQNVEEELNHE